jgi:peptide/nickel transport system permease protein
MVGIVLRRLRDIVIVLLLVGTSLFFVLHLIPGSPATNLLGEYATAEQIAALNERLGLDRPLGEQYLTWLANLLRGDLGYSFTQARPVTEVVAASVPPTMVVAVLATVLSTVIAIPLAVHAVRYPRSWVARALIPVASVGLAVPGFWLALILVLVFAVSLRWLPLSGYVSPFEDPLGAIPYLVMPLTVIVFHQVSLVAMTVRESLASETFQPYVRTARATGYREGAVMYRQVLPNALLPAVTVVGSSFSSLLGGVVIIETVFLIPGVGWVLNTAIQARDYNVILGLTLVSALVIVVVNLLVDLAYAFLDPRVRVR